MTTNQEGESVMNDMILINTEIEKHPSLYNAFTANKEAVEVLEKKMAVLNDQLSECEKKIAISEEMGLPIQAFRNARTGITSQLEDTKSQITAYQSGYLEIPQLRKQPDVIEFNNSKWWGFRFNKDTPLRILETVKKAKESELFDRLVVFRAAGLDPIMAGQIGKRFFYLGSWR